VYRRLVLVELGVDFLESASDYHQVNVIAIAPVQSVQKKWQFSSLSVWVKITHPPPRQIQIQVYKHWKNRLSSHTSALLCFYFRTTSTDKIHVRQFSLDAVLFRNSQQRWRRELLLLLLMIKRLLKVWNSKLKCCRQWFLGIWMKSRRAAQRQAEPYVLLIIV